MDRYYSNIVGQWQGRRYEIAVNVAPSPNKIEEWAVTLFYEAETGEKIEIARIDTSHGEIHFDRLFRRDQPKESVDIETPWEAETLLTERWRLYAEEHEETFGDDISGTG